VHAAEAVRVIEQDWPDVARGRTVPVRIYEPVEAKGPLPVLLFSHGLGGSRAGGEQWARLWAANGYLCVHLQHHGSDELLWKDKNPLAGFAALRRAMTVENGVLRAQDVSFVLDELARRKVAGTAPFMQADLTRIGLSGHSFGARTTVTTISTLGEKRIRAAIAFSPAPEKDEALNRERYGKIAIPFMNLTGTTDHLPFVDDFPAEDRRLPYQYMPAPDKYLLVLAGADHMVFNGQPAERKWSNQNRVVHAPLIERATLDFWNAYLKGEAEAVADLKQGGFKAAVGANGEWFAK
jgi:predicted dienelactone hydrolase